MENRYDNTLRERNQELLKLEIGHYVQRIILALEIKKSISSEGSKILEIGCGEGDSAKIIFENNPLITMDALDVSNEMIEISKETLAPFKENVHFICQDSLEYLKSQPTGRYDIITSSWTIHNFKKEERIQLLKEIYRVLSPKGKLIFLEKVFPDNENDALSCLQLQINRYLYLDEELNKEIIAHEYQDFSSVFRMSESETVNDLKKIGFSSVKIADKVERVAVFNAQK